MAQNKQADGQLSACFFVERRILLAQFQYYAFNIDT